MKALMGTNAKEILRDSRGLKELKTHIAIGKDVGVIRLSTGKVYKVRRAMLPEVE